MLRCLSLLICTAFFVTACTSFSHSDDGPYCGLRCVHTALHELGLRSDLNSLATPENLSGKWGSTGEDLLRIARQHGAKAEYRTGMSMSYLRNATTPIILHSSVAVSKTGFHHWILFLGTDGEDVLIYDPITSTHTLTSSELMSIWDGRSVIVSMNGSESAYPSWNWEISLSFVLVSASLALITRFSKTEFISIICTLVVACISAISWHAIVDYGFLHHSGGTVIVAAKYTDYDADEIELDDLLRMIGNDMVTLVDARSAWAYRISHIPTAISIPISVSHGELLKHVASMPLDKPVVVYCQSDRCSWSDEIAEQLAVRGYRTLIYRNGHDGWMHAGHPDHKFQDQRGGL